MSEYPDAQSVRATIGEGRSPAGPGSAPPSRNTTVAADTGQVLSYFILGLAVLFMVTMFFTALMRAMPPGLSAVLLVSLLAAIIAAGLVLGSHIRSIPRRQGINTPILTRRNA